VRADLRIQRVVTSGVFTLDGGTWEVDNNVWIVGDDDEAVVIDAAHDADAVSEAVGDRRLAAIVCTHAHNDHVNAAPALGPVRRIMPQTRGLARRPAALSSVADAPRRRPPPPCSPTRQTPLTRVDEAPQLSCDLIRRTGPTAATGAPILLHLDDRLLWKQTHPDRAPDGYLSDNQRIGVAGTHVSVLHTPGHTPGAICLHLPDLGTVFTGDTLFAGGPGATGRSYSDFPTIVRSIRDRLLVLPESTTVRTGHGPETTIGDEAPHLETWIARGH